MSASMNFGFCNNVVNLASIGHRFLAGQYFFRRAQPPDGQIKKAVFHENVILHSYSVLAVPVDFEWNVILFQVFSYGSNVLENAALDKTVRNIVKLLAKLGVVV